MTDRYIQIKNAILSIPKEEHPKLFHQIWLHMMMQDAMGHPVYWDNLKEIKKIMEQND